MVTFVVVRSCLLFENNASDVVDAKVNVEVDLFEVEVDVGQLRADSVVGNVELVEVVEQSLPLVRNFFQADL
jgi:hypothetical protein